MHDELLEFMIFLIHHQLIDLLICQVHILLVQSLIVVSVTPLLLLFYPCNPILLLFFPYIIIVTSARITLWPHGLLYIERSFRHLYHPKIVHLCNLKEVSLSKYLIYKALISLLFHFWSWFHNIWYQRFGFQGFASPNRSSWNFHYNIVFTKVQKLKFLSHVAEIQRTSCKNSRAQLTIFLEI